MPVSFLASHIEKKNDGNDAYLQETNGHADNGIAT